MTTGPLDRENEDTAAVAAEAALAAKESLTSA